MANNQRPERIEIKELPVAEQEMSEQDMKQVQGGKDGFVFKPLPMDPPPPLKPVDIQDPPLRPIVIKP